MTNAFDPKAAAQRIVAARKSNTMVASHDVLPPDRAGAYAVQDATLADIGPAAGWKVGSKDATSEPSCAPLPASGLLASGASFAGPKWPMRGVEVEVAVRFARDFAPGGPNATREAIAAAIDCVLPAIEEVETRLADWKSSDPLAQLADLGTHGALVLGTPSRVKPADVDLRNVHAVLTFDGKTAADTLGGNTAVDVWRMLAWLAWHTEQRGKPLRAGDVVTTGSCTGMLFAPAGALVVGDLEGIGSVRIHF